MGQRGRPPTPGALTPREREVVALVAKGHTNREAAERLGISEQGVRFHLNQVYQKLGLESREALVAWYRESRQPLRRLAAFPLPALGPLAKGAAFGLAGVALIGATVAVLSTRGDSGSPAASVAELTAPTPFASPTPAGEPCTIESPLLDGPTPAECFRTLDELADVLPFRPFRPSDGRVSLQVAARVDIGMVALAFIRFAAPAGVAETLQGDHASRVPLDGRTTGQFRPFAVSAAGDPSEPLLGFVAHTDGRDVAYWCPAATDEAVELAGNGCPGDLLVAITGVDGGALEELAALMAAERSGTVVAPPVTPIPLPTPTGGHADPLIAGVPIYPGAVAVDGWLAESNGTTGPTTQAVQQFETGDADGEVFAFFAAELEAQGYVNYHGSGGVSGRSMEFTRNGETEWVGVSTYYIPPPGYTERNPPPGFRGKGVPFDLRQGGPTRFYVITWTQ